MSPVLRVSGIHKGKVFFLYFARAELMSVIDDAEIHYNFQFVKI